MRPTRRQFTRLLGGGTLAASASPVWTSDATGRETARSELRVATTAKLRSMSPFDDSGGGKGAVVNAVYDPGIVFHPATGEPMPWLFTDWTASTGEATVTATLRRDLTWSDGEPVTATDAAFSVEYARDHTFPFALSNSSTLDKVETATATGQYEVTYEFTEPVGSWQDVLATLVVPEHVWMSVDSPAEYAPTDHGGPVGSGAYEVASFHPDEQVTLVARPADEYPLVDGSPTVERVTFWQHQSTRSAVQRVEDGEADVVYEHVSQSEAPSPGTQSDLDLASSRSGGWSYAGFNLRRVPFDDVAFRQLFARSFDDEYYRRQQRASFREGEADLPIPDAFSELRPYPPDADEAEQFPFLGNAGDDIDVAAARSFLLEHADASHDYSFGEAVSGSTSAPDGRELYVDGRPLTEAHTDNDGNAGQGVLTFTISSHLPDSERQGIAKWIDDLQRVGVPIEIEVVEFNRLLQSVFYAEDFDAYKLNWLNLYPTGSFLDSFYNSDEADLPGDEDRFVYNPMGYGGADELLDRAASTMDPDRRRQALVQAAERIYEDCPTVVLGYERYVQPVDAGWTGRVPSPAGVVNRFSLLGSGSLPGSPEVRVAVSADTAVVGQTVTFDASESTDPDGEIARYEWDVGADGSVDGSGATFSTAFDGPGVKRVAVRVTDDDGRTSTKTVTIEVGANESPSAAIDVSPAEPVAGQTVTFDASESTDPDGEIARYEWDVGADGSVDGTGQQHATTFDGPGERTVRLRVVDGVGASATAEVTVEVAPASTSTTGTESGSSDTTGESPGTTEGASGASGTTGEERAMSDATTSAVPTTSGAGDSDSSVPGFGVVSAAVATAGALAALARRHGEDEE